MDESKPPAAPEPTPARIVPEPVHADGRKVAGKILSVIIVAVAVVLVLWVWGILEHHPRTDDAVARANVVEIVPRVRGQIVKLCVEDNQAVKEGDLLFEIDPDDYNLALQKANADLAALDQQIAVARSQDVELKFAVKAAEAEVEAGSAQLQQAGDTLHRMEPLLPKGFATAEQVDQARTADALAVSGLAGDEQRLNQAKAALSALDTLTAQRPGAVAAVDLAKLDLSYCEVRSPFPGRVISLNISAGAYASAGIPVFSLLDTQRWYVMANFREGELRHMGLNPLVSTATGITATAANGVMTMTYTLADAAVGARAQAWWSNDLQTWSTARITQTMLSDTGTIQLWQATVPMSSQGFAMFMRLQISGP